MTNADADALIVDMLSPDYGISRQTIRGAIADRDVVTRLMSRLDHLISVGVAVEGSRGKVFLAVNRVDVQVHKVPPETYE